MNGRLVSSKSDKARVGLLVGERSVDDEVEATPHAPITRIHRGGVVVIAGLVRALVVADDAPAIGVVVVGEAVAVVVIPVHADVRILLLGARGRRLLRREADHLPRRQLGALAADETEAESQKGKGTKHLTPLSLG